MHDLLILGTDTDAGKTSLALLWLTTWPGEYEYWKPLETGDSDSDHVRRCVPEAYVHEPLARFEQPVAPLLAARIEGRTIPSARVVAAARPAAAVPGRSLLVETFGSPFSPLGDSELQIELVRELNLPTVLAASSAVGAIGRTLQCLEALERYSVRPRAVVFLGEPSEFLVEQMSLHWPNAAAFCLSFPVSWESEDVRRSALEQTGVLAKLGESVGQTLVRPGGLKPTLRTPVRQYGRKSILRQESPAETVSLDRRFVWHPYTSLRDPDAPLVVVGGEDEFLWLADGRRVIDGISSWWTILHGHRHPVLMAALDEATQRFDHVHFAGVTHSFAVELARLLLGTAPWSGGRVFYSDNGSTAVEVALKMAYQYWCHQGQRQRTRFVGFEGGYHGDTFGAMSVGRDPVFFGSFEPLLFRADIVALSAERLDEALARRAGTVAAVIIEPLVQGAGGMRMHSAEELRRVAEVASRHGVLLIADEVMTGGARTGHLWAHQAARIVPDLICAAKTLAGGVLPLAATLAAPSLVAAWDTADRSRTFFHGHSFTAHPLACAVAAANWRMLAAAPPAAPRRMESFWSESLAPLSSHPLVRDVRICGSIAAAELKVPGGYLADVGRRLRMSCLEQGVLLRPLGSVLYAMPPFCTSDESLERIAHAMRHAVGLLE